MNNRLVLLLFIFTTILFAISCTTSSVETSNEVKFEDCAGENWIIPCQQIVNAVGKDDIPSIDNPKFTTASDVSFLEDWELVHGIKIGDKLKAYPNVILYYHEIVNDSINGTPIAVTYCPLTGSGIAWNRTIGGQTTSFGVSGFIHKNNLIAYDRSTNSFWSQMKNQSIGGEFKSTTTETIQIVEMTWGAWRNAFPESQVLNTNTGFDRNYNQYLYGKDYSEDDERILFPIFNEDNRLKRKELVHNVIDNLQAKTYPLSNFGDNFKVINDSFEATNLVVVGNSKINMAISFSRILENGTELTFSSTDKKFPIVLEDQEGTKWNIFGEAVSGPRKGQELKQIQSYNAYWFAIADFYPFPTIFKN